MTRFAPHLPLLTAASIVLFAAPAQAQFTGGVFGPVVKEGASSAQYRGSIDFDGANGDTQIGQRVHYQSSLSDKFQLRGVLASRTVGGDKLVYDYAQAELTWQITPDGKDYQTGLRFDARTRDEGRAEQIGVNWMHQLTFDDGWQARGILLSTVQVADKTSDDIALGARAQLTKKLETGHTLGLQYYGSLGTTNNFRAFKRGGDTAGPFVAFPLGDGVALRTGALFGLDNAARDTQFRVWLGKNF